MIGLSQFKVHATNYVMVNVQNGFDQGSSKTLSGNWVKSHLTCQALNAINALTL